MSTKKELQAQLDDAMSIIEYQGEELGNIHQKGQQLKAALEAQDLSVIGVAGEVIRQSQLVMLKQLFE